MAKIEKEQGKLEPKEEAVLAYLKRQPLGVDGRSVANEVQVSLREAYVMLNALADRGLVNKAPDWYKAV